MTNGEWLHETLKRICIEKNATLGELGFSGNTCLFCRARFIGCTNLNCKEEKKAWFNANMNKEKCNELELELRHKFGLPTKTEGEEEWQ